VRLWHVVTPPYPYTEVVCEYGGPTYDICDVIEIEAETKRDAIALGVVEMLKGGWADKYRCNRFSYCLDQRDNFSSPYTGVYAIPVE